MSRWELIGTANVASDKLGDGEQLQLFRRHDEFSLRIPSHGELMNSRTHGSEDALGALACEKLANQSQVKLLVGGLGMGFTLTSALAVLADDANVVVAELIPEVVRWNEEWLGHCAGYPLRDPRVQVHVLDVITALRNATQEYDAVLLDVDNGPEGLLRRENDRLYSLAGLHDAYQALRAGGTLAVWSAGRDTDFTARLKKSGFAVSEHRVRAHGKKGARHTIWLAERRP